MSRKQKKYHFIYKTTDTRNGNFYIGMHSTDDLEDGYVGSGDRIRNLKYRHGKEIFSMEILEFLPDRKSLAAREAELVNSDLLKEDKCMNLKPGGSGGFVNAEHSYKFHAAGGKKVRQLLNKRHCERLKSDPAYYDKWIETITGYNNWEGKSHSDETKKKIGEANSIKQKGSNNSQYGTMWITNGDENKKIKKDSEIPSGWYKGRK